MAKEDGPDRGTRPYPAAVATRKERLVQIMTYKKTGRTGLALALIAALLLTGCGAAMGPQTQQPAAEPPTETPASVTVQGKTPEETAPEESVEEERQELEEQILQMELEQQRLRYAIDENAVVAPPPDPEGYAVFPSEQADQVLALAEQARDWGLLTEDEALAFSAEADFVPDSEIRTYLDPSIFSICWKELIDGNTCSFCETRVADGSQLRRKLAEDSYGSSIQYYASELAAQTNAVAAMNADYYLFRDLGVAVYNRQLYRFREEPFANGLMKYNAVDNCFITGTGELLFTRAGEEFDREEMEQYIADNDVIFSFAFGPVLVDDGKPIPCDGYPVGEVNQGYSRAGIGQLGHLHYLYMSLNHSPEKEARWTVTTFAQHFAEKGVERAYCLDGGQTGELVFQGQPFNHIDFGTERLVSDIFYFASAIPAEDQG